MPIESLKVGITGGIGSGKSLVCQIFKVLGIPVYHSDDRAKSLMTTDKDVVKKIYDNFGEDAYLPDGNLNREFLARTVFSDKKKRKKINSIVHPAVADDFQQWSMDHGKFPFVIKEAALLVDSGSYKSLDYLISVIAPMDLRIERVLKRDNHRTREQVESIINGQLDDQILISHSQFVISNDNKVLLLPQVIEIHEKLISLTQTG